jgi:hypothetical protein
MGDFQNVNCFDSIVIIVKNIMHVMLGGFAPFQSFSENYGPNLGNAEQKKQKEALKLEGLFLAPYMVNPPRPTYDNASEIDFFFNFSQKPIANSKSINRK